MTTTNHQNQFTYISLGYRCSTAGILKRLGLKHESFPFDWMISRLPIIKHCIETRFAYFIDPKWYVKKQTHTTHYHKGTTPVPMKICNETIYENVYYANLYQDQTPKTMNIPQPLSRENGDTYAHLLAINHRNINDPETQAYYARCIDRFFHYWEPTTPTPTPVIGIYIHPTITEKEYQDQTNDLQQEFRELYEKTMPKHWSAVFFIIVRTNHPYPITDHIPDCLQLLYTDTTNQQQPTNQQPTNQQPTNQQPTNQQPTNQQPTNQTTTRNIRIYVVYTNRDFVDAGEIFMHNPYIEIDKIMGGTKVPPNPLLAR